MPLRHGATIVQYSLHMIKHGRLDYHRWEVLGQQHHPEWPSLILAMAPNASIANMTRQCGLCEIGDHNASGTLLILLAAR